MQVNVPEPRRIVFEQQLETTYCASKLELLSAPGVLLDQVDTSGACVTEVDCFSSKKSSPLIFVKKAGGHESGDLFKVTSKHLKGIWGCSSAGGIKYEDFGSVAEILVGRYGPQVGIPTAAEKRFGHYFQEVWVLNRGNVKCLGVRKYRDRVNRTLKSELVPGSVPEG